jgi:pyruvate/2-oxoglutarate dehydrogenase complex dihydrolipoamide dehydrogenase (E3) component
MTIAHERALMTTRFDAIIIGAGQAGPALAARLAGAGWSVALIEREHLGGTCVNDGCTPTKTLVASARAAHVARRAADWGVRIDGTVSVDMKAVKARKDAVVAQSVDGLERWLGGLDRFVLVRGHARFTGAHTVQVQGAEQGSEHDGETFEAPKIFVNTGGRATLPPWPGIDGVPVLNNTSVLELDVLPEHLIVAGASYIGLEFAQVYRRFGAHVTVIDVADRPIAREDEDVSRAVQAMLEGEGVEFVLGATDVRVEPGDGAGRAPGAADARVPSAEAARVRVHLSASGATHVIQGSHLLAAVGRRPNTDDLGLDRAGIVTDARGFITVDDELRTNVEGVWALGDVNGRGAFTHTSYNDYEIVAANLLDGEHRRVSDRIPVYALFTDPPLARIGIDKAQALASGKPALIATMPMTRVGRARERGETAGFMEVIVDAQTERILGATLLGIEADEVIHALLDVMAAGASYRVIQRCMHIHPTVSELVPTLLGDLRPLRK